MKKRLIKLIHADYRLIMDEIKDHSIDLLITDPPYGIIKHKNVAVKGLLNAHKAPKNDCGWDLVDLIPFTQEWFNLVKPKCKENTFAFIFWSQKYLKQGFQIFNPDRLIFWRYNNFTLGGGGSFAYDYDPIFVCRFGNPKLIKGKHSCDLQYTKPQSNFRKDRLVHPTQKPLDLIKHLITIASPPGALVLDIFGGAGTTAIAAAHTNRQAIVIEKEEQYHKKAVARLEEIKLTC